MLRSLAAACWIVTALSGFDSHSYSPATGGAEMKRTSNKPACQESDAPRARHAAGNMAASSPSRRDRLTRTAGALAAVGFGAAPRRGYAAEPVNVGRREAVTGSRT